MLNRFHDLFNGYSLFLNYNSVGILHMYAHQKKKVLCMDVFVGRRRVLICFKLKAEVSGTHGTTMHV